MKSILQSVAVASVVVLISSCDSSSGGTVSPPPPTSPVITTAGTAVKGLIDGAPVTATDSDGDPLGTGTTQNGAYSITYNVAQLAAGVRPPVKITVGSGTTVCDLDNPGTDDDCRTGVAATPFVKFGETYALASDFQLISYLPTQNVTANSSETVNVSPATHIAALKADSLSTANGATSDDVVKANNAIAGLIQSITGIDMSGTPLHQISVADLTATGGSPTPSQLALAAFAAAILADQGVGESIGDVIARFANSITVNTDGSASATGNNLAIIANALAKGLATAAAKSGNAAITAAAKTATDNAALYKKFGDNPVKLPPVQPPGTDKNDVQKTQDFVKTLGAVINGIISTTGANTNVQSLSVTETFAKELNDVAKLSSNEAGKAAAQLDTAIKAASKELSATTPTITNDATTIDGLEFVITKTDTGFTLAGVKSQWPIKPVTDSVVVTIAGATGSSLTTGISVPNATMTTKKGATTLQVFTGEFTTTSGDAAGKFATAAFKGDIVGQVDGTKFAIDASLTNVDTTGASTTGAYTATFKFTHATAASLDATFSGAIGGNLQNFTLKSGDNTVNGSVTRTVVGTTTTDVDVITDGTTFLTLEVVNNRVTVGQNDIIGNFKVGSGASAVATGTLANDGRVTYSDNTVQFLPAIIF